ncbi:MAG: lytic transglycosylase domain-containing protein [Acidobacteriota bacterium]
MTTRDTRVPALVFSIFLLAVLAPLSAVSEESSYELPPEAINHELMADVGSWISESPRDLRRSMRDRAESFQVFLSYHDESARIRALDGVPYGAAIGRAATRHGVDPLLLASIAEVESRFNPRAVSHRGAVGLVQVLPSTARLAADRLFDPEVNLDRGGAYLRYLLERFGGDLELALAGYNAGPNAVRRHGGVPPYRETRTYVRRVLEIYVEHHRELWRSSDAASLLSV